ncbi:MAG TPA: O-antigen ligase family protein [Lacipirellulaceae bacterium]|nr:O-antigen ligase family protein [Lacipirellulaceae bacterium]
MIQNLDNHLRSDTSLRTVLTAWCVGLLITGSLIGLVHDPNYANARDAELVEDGRGINEKTVMEGGLEAAGAGRALGLILLLAAGGVCLATMPQNAHFQWDGLTFLIGLGVLWASISVLWSNEPGVTIRELLRLLVYAGVAIAIARRFDPRTLCYVLAIALGGSVLAAVSFEILTGGFTPWVSDYRLTGSLHSNILAVQALVVALIGYAFAIRRHGRTGLWWTVFVAATFVVYLTKARTELVSLAAGMAAVHVLGRPARNWLFLAAAGATLLAVGLLGAETLGLTVTRDAQAITTLGRTDDVSALTGRVPLWHFIWRQLPGHYLQGFGAGTFWLVDRTIAASDALGWFPRHSHNAYIQVIVDLGFIGLAIALAIAVWATARATRLVERTGLPEYSAIAAILIGIFVDGVAESAFVMPRDMGLFAAATVLSLVVVHQRAASTTLASAASPKKRQPPSPLMRPLTPNLYTKPQSN